jgi:hypothetical protein
VLADFELLRRSNVLPTSLLELNLQLLPRTGRMLGLRQLAAWLQHESERALVGKIDGPLLTTEETDAHR